MAIDIGTICDLSSIVVATLALFRDRRADQRELVNQGLTALYTAVNETRDYIATIQDGAPRNAQQEEGLARLWELVAIPLRHLDQDLARRCDLKAGYWRGPSEWPPELVIEARIGLDRVFKEAKYLLVAPH